MSTRVAKVVSLTLVVLVAAALGTPAAGGQLVVVLVNATDTVPADRVPSLGAPCGEALKSLKTIGMRIADVQGGEALVYTLQRDAFFGWPAAVAVVACAPEAAPDR